MEYTRDQKIMIGNATFDAMLNVEHAANLLQVFWETYCDMVDSPLAYDAKERPDIINSQIIAISNFLYEALKELKPFNE